MNEFNGLQMRSNAAKQCKAVSADTKYRTKQNERRVR